jgi:hypothetical protein
MNATSRRNLFAALPTGAAVLALGTAESVRAATTQSLTAVVSNFVFGTGGFAGTLTITGFNVAHGVLNAASTLSVTRLDPTGAVVGSITQTLAIPTQVTASCQILSLTLGPLHLDVLGLAIDLNQVVLNIAAVPGAGDLLGNLLCAVANLLNGGGELNTLLNNLMGLLNQILAAL